MNEQPVVMVQVADPEWTWAALQAACTLARNCGGCVALLHTVCVKHPSYLGTEMGYLDLGDQDVRSLRAYADMVASYGLGCDVTIFQAYSRFGCIAEAAEQVGAWYIYAKPPASRIPFWSASQFELLRVQLSRHNCELLDVPASLRSRRQAENCVLPAQQTKMA